MGCAIGVDDDGVGDVLDDAGAGKRLRRPSGRRRISAAGAVTGDEGPVGKEPEGVFGGGIGGRAAFLDPVDGGEDDEVVRCRGLLATKVDPEQAACGEKGTAQSGDRDVAVVVGEDLAGNGEVVEGGGRECARTAVDGGSPEGLGRGEVLLEEGAETEVLQEIVLAALLVGVVGRGCQIHSMFSEGGFWCLFRVAGGSGIGEGLMGAIWAVAAKVAANRRGTPTPPYLSPKVLRLKGLTWTWYGREQRCQGRRAGTRRGVRGVVLSRAAGLFSVISMVIRRFWCVG